VTAYTPDINDADHKKQNLSLQQLAAGRSNATGTITLTINSATTVVTTPTGICAPGSKINLTPTTANAATEFGAGTWYISSVGVDTFTITHINSATASRTFAYDVVG